MLSPDGVLISVSFGQPHFRVPLVRAALCCHQSAVCAEVCQFSERFTVKEHIAEAIKFAMQLTACGRHTWNCSGERFGGSFDYFVYVLRKGRRPVADDSMHQGADAEAAAVMTKLGPTVRSRTAEQEAPMHDHMDEESYLMQMTL